MWDQRESHPHDGRHLKILGDGCIVAFEDPRSALAFAEDVRQRGSFRVGVALGLMEVVEGELAGRTVFEAARVAKACLRRYQDPARGVSVRDLDGQRWTVVHQAWNSETLTGRLGALGWDMAVTGPGDEEFLWATARRRT